MKVLAQPSGTGKTKTLIDDAIFMGAQILTTNKRALQQKIKDYGRPPVDVIDLNDLIYGNYDKNKLLFIHRMEDVIADYFKSDFDLELVECSVATEPPPEPVAYI